MEAARGLWALWGTLLPDYYHLPTLSIGAWGTPLVTYWYCGHIHTARILCSVDAIWRHGVGPRHAGMMYWEGGWGLDGGGVTHCNT